MRYKMKKIICMIMVICLMATIGLTAAHAEGGNYTMSTGSSTLTYTEPSRYMIYIPETIDMDVGRYTFEAAEMNITSNEDVVVTMTNLDVNSMLTFTHEDGASTANKCVAYDYNNIDSNIQQSLPEHCVAYFEKDELNSEMCFYLANDNYNTNVAGSYSGTAEFQVELRSH